MGENVEARIAGSRQRFYERHVVVFAPHENIADSPEKTGRIFPEIINFYSHITDTKLLINFRRRRIGLRPKTIICKNFCMSFVGAPGTVRSSDRTPSRMAGRIQSAPAFTP